MTASRDDGESTNWMPWFYGAMAALGLVGAGLIGYTLAGGGAGDDAPVSSTAPAASPSASADAADGQQDQEFPAQFDTLGVAKGAEDAPVVVREFADYQCPACGSFFPTARKIDQEYVESGQVRFIFFDFPLTSQHPNAMAAAQAARCADRQDAYWAMHDALFENQDEWSGLDDPVAKFSEYAAGMGIDADRLASCVRNGDTQGEVERSREFARALGVSSTPTLVVGNVGVRGAASWSRVRQLIEERLPGGGGGAGGTAAGSTPGSSAAGSGPSPSGGSTAP